MLGLSAVVAAITQVLIVPADLAAAARHRRRGAQLRPAGHRRPGVAFAASAISATGVPGPGHPRRHLVLTGILTVVVSRAVLGQRSRRREAWDRARPRLPALLGVTVLVLRDHARAGRARARARRHRSPSPVHPTAAVAVALRPRRSRPSSSSAAYLYIAFALAPPAIVLERQRVVASLRRSRALVRGAWWRTFGILLLVNLIAQVLAGILGVPFTVLDAAAWPG